MKELTTLEIHYTGTYTFGKKKILTLELVLQTTTYLEQSHRAQRYLALCLLVQSVSTKDETNRKGRNKFERLW